MIRQYFAKDCVGDEGARAKAKELASVGYEILAIEHTRIPWERPDDETGWHCQRFVPGYQITVDTAGATDNRREKIPKIVDILKLH